MNLRPTITIALTGLLTIVLAACAAGEIPTQPPQPPSEYLANALDWIETHSVKINTVDWPAVREQALALAPEPQTTAETYPALLYVMQQLGDAATFFLTPTERQNLLNYVGFEAYYPGAIIIGVDPGGPAAQAGLQIGDVIETINGVPPRPWQGTPFLDLYADPGIQMAIRREGQTQPITVMLEKINYNGATDPQPHGRRISTDQGNLGYIELPQTGEAWAMYPTRAQQAIREIDRTGTCGWIVDVRHNPGGDIWSYIAAIGPILGEGMVGGFVFLDEARELWRYEGGKVFWDDDERHESLVEGPIYSLERSMPPVALLTSHATMAAGELIVVTFQGRPNVRVFGEATGGSPFLVFHTDLSDGAFLGVSGAVAMDRTARIYDGAIEPDEAVITDWKLFGTDQDPVIRAATDWLLNQPECAR